MENVKLEEQPLIFSTERDYQPLNPEDRYKTRKSHGFLIILAIFITAFLLFSLPRDSISTRMSSGQSYLSNYKIKTFKGEMTLEEANNNVFIPQGYQIIEPTLPVPRLKFLHPEPTCETTFSEWIRISGQSQPTNPPKTFPTEMVDAFLLNGYTAVQYSYRDDKNSANGEKPSNWDKISEIIKQDVASIANYGRAGVSVYTAMKNFNLQDMKGFVVGSMKPWVEIYALLNGAKHVLTVEYNKLEIQEEFKDRMESILPIDFAKNWNKYAGTFDFAASFSSIEHSGIGRYGDPVDPIGDLREMAKIKCMLKPGGLLFLGMPQGTDALVFNLHRIYGSLRLAMMFTGFEWIGTYSEDQAEPYDLNSTTLHQPLYSIHQNTLVLRKI